MIAAAESVRPDLVPTSVPMILLLLGVVLAAGVIYGWYRLRPRTTYGVRLAGDMAAGAFMLEAVLQVLGRLLRLESPLPVWLVALFGGAALVGVTRLYAFELQAVPPRPGYLVRALRWVAVLLILFLILQPVWVGESTVQMEQDVIVLMDDSLSMDRVDHVDPATAGQFGAWLAGEKVPDPEAPGEDPEDPSGDTPPNTESPDFTERLLITSRREIGTWLLDGAGAYPGLLPGLADRYGVRTALFAAGVQEQGRYLGAGQADPEPAGEAVGPAPVPLDRGQTDLAGALEIALAAVPPDRLAGVVVLTDGRHNAPRPVEDLARRAGNQHTPVVSVLMGSTEAPPDAALTRVRAPQALYLTDRLVVDVEIHMTGMKGREAVVELRREDEIVDSVEIQASTAPYRTRLRLMHVPEHAGVQPYTVQVIPRDVEEQYPGNNSRSLRIAVSDDRTNVLLIDSYPRWEFRYLRNLLHARDKSIHLQYVLTRADQVAGARTDLDVPASVARPFGESEATRLPESEEEWKRFDVIVIGDVEPETLRGHEALLVRWVEEWGGMLILSAGPRYMPHAYSHADFKTLWPMTWNPADGVAEPPEARFRMQLSREGRESPIMRMAPSRLENDQVWSGFPDLSWRHPGLTAKPGARVLLTARPEGDSGSAVRAGTPDALDQRLSALARQDQLEREQALLCLHRAGAGTVAMLALDQTWRLRYQVGDTFHHAFWGQLIRYGAPPPLRAGTERLRLGTDRVVYRPGDPVEVTARLEDEQRRPLGGKKMDAVLWLDDEEISRHRLSPEESRAGHYGVVLDRLEPGAYTLQLDGRVVERSLQDEEINRVEAAFWISRDPAEEETAFLQADWTLPRRVAELSGGAALHPWELDEVFTHLRPSGGEQILTRQVALWDSPWLLLLLTAVLTTEWIMRKKVGLP